MDRKAVSFALCLVIMMTLAGAATLATPDGPTDGGGSRESRATPIDGGYEDEFDVPDNLTVEGDVGVVDGEITVIRTVFTDGFDRLQLAPWTRTEGNPRISQGRLLTNGTEMAGAMASVDIDRHDLELHVQLSIGVLGTGPRIVLSTAASESIWATYDNGAEEIQLWLTNGTGDHELGHSLSILQADQWYYAGLTVQGGSAIFEIGAQVVQALHGVQGNFNSLSLGVPPNGGVAWDNVTINKLGGSGRALTDPVSLPVDTFWTDLSIEYFKPQDGTLKLSLVDPSTGLSYLGFNEITSNHVDLRDDLDPTKARAVQLRMDLSTTGTVSPRVLSWSVSWQGDPPKFIKPIPNVEMDEDTPRTDVIDMRNHFEDRFTDKDNLTFTVAEASNEQNVKPVIDGHMLGFQLPTPDYFGTEYYRIRCSDGTLTVDSLQCTVVVKPVDDPPLVRPFGRVDMYEDEEFELNLTPYLEDSDTPVQVLRLRALSDYARVEGQHVFLYYDKGGNDRIEMQVSDYSNDVQFFIDVTVREVDDPPVFKQMDKVAMYEDDVRTVDLSKYLSDEDTPIEDLYIDVENGDEYISLDGLIITLHYGDTGGDFEYTILASDDNSTVSQVLDVSVREVNDPPRVVSVGDMEPVDGQVSWTMTEGNTSELLVLVEDEESTNFFYTLVSDMEGASMVGRYLNLAPEEGQVGTYNLQISISDGAAATVVKVAVEVLNRNDPVQDVAISEPTNGTRVQLGTPMTLKGYAFDPDFAFNQKLNYTWTSDLDGPLGAGKVLEGVNLTKGDHTITLSVTDGEYTGTAIVTLTVFSKDGGGGGGGGGGNDGGGVGSSGLSIGIIIGIVIAVVIALVLFVAMRTGALKGTEQVTFSEPSPQQEPLASAAEAFDKPPEKPGAPPAKRERPAGAAGESAEAPTKAPVAPPTPVATPRPKYEAVAIDTASLAGGDDPEQKRLDNLKREYQAAISALPWGVPAKELAHMDWYELAAAMATGEHKNLDDGRPVVQIGDHWYYADTEDPKTFLRRHE